MLYILTPVFCAGLCLGTVFSFINNKAYGAATVATVNELTISGSGAATNGYVFKQENLNTLYNKILNQESGATLADIKSRLSGTATYAGAGTVNKMIRSDEINGGALLKVNFGGFEWQVTSATTSNGGDVIATLWMTDNNPSVAESTYTADNNPGYSTPDNQTYSSSIYGTSIIRTRALNAGGNYVIVDNKRQGSLSTTPISQSASHIFAKFTMTSVTNNLTNYIVQPKDVAYQSQESFAGLNYNTSIYNCMNDAYGTPYINAWRANLDDCVNKLNYSAWQNDYLWLPSVTEVGGAYSTSPKVTVEGIWNMQTLAVRARAAAWIRSSLNSDWVSCIYYNSNGYFASGYPCNNGGVRPAIHLNLTKAQAAAATILSNQPSAASSNLTYNEHEQTYTPLGFDSTTMEITGNKATIVDDYTCSVTPKAGYTWANYDTSAVEIPWKMEKGTPNVTLGYVDTNIDLNKLYLKDYGTLPAIQNVHEQATAGSLNWNSGEVPVKNKQGGYKWTFTPTDTANYNDVTGAEPLVFKEAQITGLQVTKNDGKDIYDKYNTAIYNSLEAYIKSCITVKIKYEDNTVSTSPVADGDYSVTTNDISVTSGTSQSKTISVRVKNTAENTQLRGMTGSLTTDVNKAVINSMSVELADDPKTLTYPLTLADVKANYAVYLGWNFAPLELLADESKVTVALKDGGELSAGTLTFLFTYTDGSLTQTSDPVDIEISKGTFNVDDITFVGNTEKIVYDGQPHKLEISGTLPDGVSVEYTVTGQTATEFTNAGSYVYTASFKHENGNYNAITKTLTATLTISQATYVMPTGYQTSKQATYTGSQIALPANWISGLPSGVSVKYYEVVNNVVSATEFTGATNIDVYNLKAVFTVDDPVNYEVPDPVDLTFEITKKNVYTDNLSFTVTGAEESGNNAYTATYSPDTTVSFELGGNLVKTDGTEVTPALTYTYERQADGAWVAASAADLKNAGTYRVTVAVKNEDATYADVDNKVITLTIKKADYTLDEALFKGATVEFDGKDHTLTIGGELPDWITEVVYTVEGQDGTSFSAVGTYDFTATFKHENGNYNDVQPLYATLKINTAGVALDVTFNGDTVTYDGGIHMIALDGTLPAWVTVTYYVGEEEFTGAVNAGTYEVVARFTVDESLYNKPEEMTATLTIEAAVYELTGVTFENGAFVYDGEAHSIFIGGAELPEWITVSYTGNEVSEIGTHTVVAKFTHENGNYKMIGDMTAQIVISKAKIALPVYKGTLSYSGDEIKPTAADFEGFDSALMSFVESKTAAGLNAGTYKAVFALTDTERYEWATATTYKKALFAVVYDEVVLEDYEAAVEWNIAKAKISATKANGKLPVFASESFSGSFADIVGLKYYTDETCAEEISADELAYSTKYYVKAELLDGTNFELDESATVFAKTAFEYTTPEKQLTIWEKIVKFVVTNWLWIVIAVVALILLITIIACAARASRKKREREEQRRLEEKAERERREEREEQRRREEREERMAARMAMPQMMPQMPPMGQMQAAQPMAAGGAVGGASSNELAELKAEMAAMKASQDMAKELAIRAEMTAREMALRAEQNAVMRSDINALRGGDQTSGIIGISIDKLTELVEKTVERVLSGKEKPAAAAAESNAAPVTAQVPPDAVMTTVTTTKIDTTKKPAQTAQAPAPAVRTVVRNVVAPMPVDDGRVFDVGGFYTPADPVTDMANLLGDDDKNE